jgi:uncharacterized membrane protein YjfL (UPF0719 family)
MTEIMWVSYSAGYLVLAVLFLLLAKKLFDLATPFSLDVQLTEKDNAAVGLLLTGFLIGVAAVICSVFAGEGPAIPSIQAFVAEVGPIVLYGLLGCVCLFVAGILNDKITLRKFANSKEIVDNGNVAVAAVMAATYVGSGLIIAGGISGSQDLVSALVAFVVGQVFLLVFAGLYQLVTPYDDQAELGTNRNLAAGIGFGGNIVAFSMVIMKGVALDVENVELWTWGDRLLHMLYYAVAGCVLLGLTRIINDRLFLPKASLSKEIAEDRNISAGLVEAGLALAMGAALVFCL